jgi:hypothetical protein
MRIFCLSLLIGIVMASCKTPGAVTSSNDISIGRACGMCMGQCYQGYRLQNGTVEHFSARNIDGMDSAKFAKATAQEEKDFRELVSLLPPDLKKYPGRVGCPDCHDQCGIQVISSTGKILIDPSNHPEEFNKFFQKIEAMGGFSKK